MNVATAPLEPDNCGMTQSIAATPIKLVLPSISPPAHNCNKLKTIYIRMEKNITGSNFQISRRYTSEVVGTTVELNMWRNTISNRLTMNSAGALGCSHILSLSCRMCLVIKLPHTIDTLLHTCLRN